MFINPIGKWNTTCAIAINTAAIAPATYEKEIRIITGILDDIIQVFYWFDLYDSINNNQ